MRPLKSAPSADAEQTGGIHATIFAARRAPRLHLQASRKPVASTAATPPDRARELTKLTIAPSAISLPTHGATINAATLIAADQKDNSNGEFCKVLGAILPDDPAAPNINFEVNLPSQWNGKALHYGGGGYDGVLITGLANVRFFKPGTETPLKRGYVTFGSDSGHQSALPGDGSFAMNDEALRNFSGDQLKKTHDVAFDLVKRRYGRLPERLYFFGNSQGGHEGFIVIQRWPQDYDGVVSIHPVYDFVPLQLDGNALSRAMYNSEGGWIDPAKLKLLQGAVMRACDRLDGVDHGAADDASDPPSFGDQQACARFNDRLDRARRAQGLTSRSHLLAGEVGSAQRKS